MPLAAWRTRLLNRKRHFYSNLQSMEGSSTPVKTGAILRSPVSHRGRKYGMRGVFPEGIALRRCVVSKFWLGSCCVRAVCHLAGNTARFPGYPSARISRTAPASSSDTTLFRLWSCPIITACPVPGDPLSSISPATTHSSWGTCPPGVTPAYDTTAILRRSPPPNSPTSTRCGKALPKSILLSTSTSPRKSPQTCRRAIPRKSSSVAAGLGIDLAGGVTYVGSFVGGPNVSYVFSNNLAQSSMAYPNTSPKPIAHEAGHAFGLGPPKRLGSTEIKSDGEYSLAHYVYNPSQPGTQQPIEPGSRSPIMGESYFAERGLWWKGTAVQAQR